jgi:hypothetical protein
VEQLLKIIVPRSTVSITPKVDAATLVKNGYAKVGKSTLVNRSTDPSTRSTIRKNPTHRTTPIRLRFISPFDGPSRTPPIAMRIFSGFAISLRPATTSFITSFQK